MTMSEITKNWKIGSMNVRNECEKSIWTQPGGSLTLTVEGDTVKIVQSGDFNFDIELVNPPQDVRNIWGIIQEYHIWRRNDKNTKKP